MNIESFNRLQDHQKVQLIFDADKISEKADGEANYQLFKIDNFFIEARTSLEGKFKRTFTYYTLKNLPAEYASEILSIPIVKLNTDKTDNEIKRHDFSSKKVAMPRLSM